MGDHFSVSSKIKITPSMSNAIQERVSDLLNKIGSKNQNVKISIKENGKEFKISVVLNIWKKTIKSEVKTRDFYEGLYEAFECIERNALKYVEKIHEKGNESIRLPESADEDVDQDDDEPNIPNIVKFKEFDIGVMSEDEAALQMQKLGYDFFIYSDCQTGLPSVLYKRKDGDLGLIRAI